MSDFVFYGILVVLGVAVAGLGVRVMFKYKGGYKVVIKNVKTKGDVVGRDKNK